jgi:hypothetical protein
MRTLKSSTLANSAASVLQGAVAAQQSSRMYARGGTGAMPKTLTYVVCEDYLMRTDGTQNYVQEVFDIEALRELGPMIKQVRAHYVCEGATTNFTARVTTQWSVLGKAWSGTTDVLGAQTGGTTGFISGWLSDNAVFGLLMRYAIEVKNATTGTAIENGRVTVILEIELKS